MLGGSLSNVIYSIYVFIFEKENFHKQWMCDWVMRKTFLNANKSAQQKQPAQPNRIKTKKEKMIKVVDDICTR